MVGRPLDFEEWTPELINELLKEDISEFSWFDFKQEYSASIMESIAAMLSDSGGWILVGVNDKAKEIVGCDIAVEWDKINKSISLISPFPKSTEIDNKTINFSEDKELVLVKISKGSDFPYFFKGLFYCRTGYTTVAITNRDTIAALLSKRVNEEKFVRILTNEVKSLKTSVESVFTSARTLEGKTIATPVLPIRLDFETIKTIYPMLEGYLIKSNKLEYYLLAIQQVAEINSKLDVLYLNYHYLVATVTGGIASSKPIFNELVKNLAISDACKKLNDSLEKLLES